MECIKSCCTFSDLGCTTPVLTQCLPVYKDTLKASFHMSPEVLFPSSFER